MSRIWSIWSGIKSTSDRSSIARSSIFDSQLTMAMGKSVKVVSWYDNEWGYSNRTVDIMEKIAKR